MRTVYAGGLAAALLSSTACDGIGPLRPEASRPALAAGGAALRIVEPGCGQSVPVGEKVDIVVMQELHGGPGQGHGRLEHARPGTGWRPRSEFAWTRQGREFRLPVTFWAEGTHYVRFVVFRDGAGAAFLESPVLEVEALDHEGRYRVSEPAPR